MLVIEDVVVSIIQQQQFFPVQLRGYILQYVCLYNLNNSFPRNCVVIYYNTFVYIWK